MNTAKITSFVRQTAFNLGFSQVGISRAEFMEPEAKQLEKWLNQNYHGKMAYLANHFDKRLDPTLLVPGAKSVVSLLFNYHNPEVQEDPDAPKIAQYAYGKDYHFIIKKILKEYLQILNEEIGEVNGRCFVDSAPVMERDWAKRSGLGWVGKNTLLIHPKAGSYFFLAELIIDLELEPDHPIKDHCGTCTRCIDACPTEAISPSGYVMDGSKCISYLTIELKENIPEEFAGKMDNWMFGCDICQQVCPWNRFSKKHNEPELEPHPDLLKMKKSEWEEITKDVFNRIFKKSAVKRAGLNKLKETINFIKK